MAYGSVTSQTEDMLRAFEILNSETPEALFCLSFEKGILS